MTGEPWVDRHTGVPKAVHGACRAITNRDYNLPPSFQCFREVRTFRQFHAMFEPCVFRSIWRSESQFLRTSSWHSTALHLVPWKTKLEPGGTVEDYRLHRLHQDSTAMDLLANPIAHCQMNGRTLHWSTLTILRTCSDVGFWYPTILLKFGSKWRIFHLTKITNYSIMEQRA